MSLLRQSLAPIARSSRAMVAARAYSNGPSSGATASSKTFGDREKGQESEYIRKAEMEKVKALQEKIKAQRAHLDEVESALNDLHPSEQKK